MAHSSSPAHSYSRRTMAEVAEAVGVSKMTVSRVINGHPNVAEETRERILQMMQTMGYAASPIARSLRSNSNIIALVVPGLSSPYVGEIVAGITRCANRLNYGLMLYAQDPRIGPFDYAALLNSGLTDGILMLAVDDCEVLTNACKEHDLPYVLIDQHGDSQGDPAVTSTNRKGIIDAMRYLMALGHTRIGFITGQMSLTSARERLQGYRDALYEAGLPYLSELVREGDFEQRTGFIQAQALLSLEAPPTAIIASNDVSAFGVMDAVKNAGLAVGRDISVIGFDDIPMSEQVFPALTTVRQPLFQMGEEALDLLVHLIQHRTPSASQCELATELIIRESTMRLINR